MKSKPWNRYVYVAWIAFLWAVANTVYVYLFLGGARAFRIESAAYIFIAVLLPLSLWHSASPEHDEVLGATGNRLIVAFAVWAWLVTLVPYLRLPFLADDYVFLTEYTRFSDVFRVRPFFRPLFGAVFLLLKWLGSGSPIVFHIVSMALHAASAACVHILGRRLFQRSDLAAICSVIFLLNPLQLEAVLWSSGMQDLLWTVLVLSGLVVYTGERQLSAGNLLWTIALLALALCSKETAICAIFLLPAVDVAFFKMQRGRLLAVAYLSCCALVAVYLIARMHFTVNDPSYFVMPGRYFVQKFIGTPYKFFVQPWNAVAADAPAAWSCAATILAFAVAFWSVIRGTGKLALAGPFVILISTLPVYTYFYVSPDLRATRYVYFAATGWALLVTQMLGTLLERKKIVMIGAFAGYIVLAWLCLEVNAKPWRTAGDIVRDVISTLEAGRDPRASVDEWRAKYGDGVDVENGVPVVYDGVYLFVNGYPELRAMLNAQTVR